MTKQETKFRVGQVWADREGRKSQVVRIASSYKFPSLVDKVYPVTAVDIKMGTAFHVTEKGYFYGHGGQSSCDLITLIKDTEDNMAELKFKVGDKVRYRFTLDRCLGTVAAIKAAAVESGQHMAFVRLDDNKTYCWLHFEDLELVKDTEETVSNKLPPEPIPGQYYRNQFDEKVLYTGKDKDGFYIYQDDVGNFDPYDLPYFYNKDDIDEDIIAPWTEPLPAVEIKRWAVIYTKDMDSGKRGESLSVHTSLNRARTFLERYPEEKDNFEIVELVGILPAKEIT
jgi:hypothetical protein